MYELRYGQYENFKTANTEDFEQALRMFDKCQRFAERHNITMCVSLFENFEHGKWLIQSVTVNPTAIIH